jgi:lipoyl synthase
MRELRAADIDVLTIGQYLQPTPKHAPVMRYVEPAEFDQYKQLGEALGFQYIASGPLVRSSYRAAEAFLKGKLRGERVRYSDRYGKRRLEVVP